MVRKPGTRIEYLLLVTGAYCALPIMLRNGVGSFWLLLPLLSLPAAAGNLVGIYRRQGSALNQVLARTAALTLVFCLLLSAGILMSGHE